jgi:hypothetical protein
MLFNVAYPLDDLTPVVAAFVTDNPITSSIYTITYRNLLKSFI